MVLTLKWKMVKFPGRSALVIVPLVANIQSQFQLQIVDHFISTILLSPLVVLRVTAARTKSESNNFTKRMLYFQKLWIILHLQTYSTH